jgi:hypothetical protein
MRTTRYFVLAAATLAAVAGFGGYQAADKDKEKDIPEIEDIMEAAHNEKEDPNLLGRVLSGKATKEEQKKLLGLYTDLGKNKPPKGSAADWKKRTDALVAATKDVLAGKPDAAVALKKAASCKACHEAHKGE